MCRGAVGRVSIAEAAAPHQQLVQGVIILLQHLWPLVQQAVPQRVQPAEIHPQIAHLQQLCSHRQARDKQVRG